MSHTQATTSDLVFLTSGEQSRQLRNSASIKEEFYGLRKKFTGSVTRSDFRRRYGDDKVQDRNVWYEMDSNHDFILAPGEFSDFMVSRAEQIEDLLTSDLKAEVVKEPPIRCNPPITYSSSRQPPSSAAPPAQVRSVQL